MAGSAATDLRLELAKDRRSPTLASPAWLGGHIFPPIFRFRQILQFLIAADQKAAHVPVKKNSVNNPTEDAEGRLELKAINHDSAMWVRNELMIMFHSLEGTCYHDVLKAIRTL